MVCRPLPLSPGVIDMSLKLLNFGMFQVGWLATVLLGASPYHWLAPAVALLAVAFHLYLCPQPARELRLVLYALGIGLAWENALTLSGVTVYPQGQWLGSFAPLWIVSMWASLATTLNVSLRWLHDKPAFAVLLGGAGGPLAFLAGQRLGAVTFPNPTLTITVLAIGWAVLFFALVMLARRHDGFRYLNTDTRRISA